MKGESEPAKTMPTDPGGKQFAHADSKVMGRLGDGAPASDETGSATPADTDTSGTRKVTTLVVGRDGAIVPPSAPAESAPPAEPPGQSVAVPGLTVIDGFGGRRNNSVTTAAVPPSEARGSATATSRVVSRRRSTPRRRPRTLHLRASDSEDETAAPVAPKKQKMAAVPAATDEAATSAGGANGYVVVLASIPASGSSRLDALKRFADMQQKYGTVLAEQDARTCMRANARRQGRLPPSAGRPARIARPGKRAVHAAQGFGLQGLLGHGILSRHAGALRGAPTMLGRSADPSGSYL